jgi:hypothetical protein
MSGFAATGENVVKMSGFSATGEPLPLQVRISLSFAPTLVYERLFRYRRATPLPFREGLLQPYLMSGIAATGDFVKVCSSSSL